jgi:hypothetical protein
MTLVDTIDGSGESVSLCKVKLVTASMMGKPYKPNSSGVFFFHAEGDCFFTMKDVQGGSKLKKL